MLNQLSDLTHMQRDSGGYRQDMRLTFLHSLEDTFCRCVCAQIISVPPFELKKIYHHADTNFVKLPTDRGRYQAAACFFWLQKYGDITAT